MQFKGGFKRFRLIFIIILMVMVVCIGIPIVINVILSKDLIPSVGTDNADWLSFWGSFLGGIVGGIATLISITYTMKTFYYDKKPVLIPLKKEFFVYIDSEKRVKLVQSYKNTEEGITDNEFEFINVGRGAALDVKIRWTPPEQVTTGNERKDKYIDYDKNSFGIKFSKKESEFQVIRYDDRYNIEKVKFFIGLEKLIEKVVKAHVSGEIVILGPLNFVFDVSLGYIDIAYNDIYQIDNKEKQVKYEMFFKTKGLGYNKNIPAEIFFKRIR